MAKQPIQIGERWHSVTINAIVETLAADGSPTYSNGAALATVKASIVPVSGDDSYEGAQMESTATHTIEFPWSSDYSVISPKTHRIVFGSRTFHLVSVNNVDEQNRTIRCMATEQKG